MRAPQDTVADSRQRERWADNVRVAAIAGVIIAHTATAYLVDIPWYYDDERNAEGVWAVVVGAPTFTVGAFGLGPLFLIAGWFAASSLARRGPAAFARARLLRLGVPVAVFVLLIQPLTDWIGNLRDERASFSHYLATTEVGVMWFAVALLAFDLAYAGLRRLRPGKGTRVTGGLGTVVLAAATIAITSFAVWQVWPLDAEVVLSLRFGGWPQGAVLYALGVSAGESGWLRTMPPARLRRLGWTAVAAVAALGALFGAEVAWGDVAVLLGATDATPTIAFATLDGVLAVTWTLWGVAWLRHRWTSGGPLLRAAGRASYATYVMHPLILTTMMVGFGVVALPAAVKFVVVSAVGVPVCYIAGYALARAPGVNRVL
jgi:glucans biosynthesis protein C